MKEGMSRRYLKEEDIKREAVCACVCVYDLEAMVLHVISKLKEVLSLGESDKEATSNSL